ncbi:MAG: hypothetical protein KA791_07120 [Flavobacteriales bacterium]|nr:hypothetical protein [Flavobacteriales bacterium]
MGWKPDDNTRSGIHYLLLGTVIIGMIAITLNIFDRVLYQPSPKDLAATSFAPFRSGYWSATPYFIADGALPRPARITAAAGLSFLAAVLLAFLSSLVASGGKERVFTLVSRATMLVAFISASYAVLFVPVRMVSFDASLGEWSIREHPLAIADIPLGPAATKNWPLTPETSFDLRFGQEERFHLLMGTGPDTIVLAHLSSGDPQAITEARLLLDAMRIYQNAHER